MPIRDDVDTRPGSGATKALRRRLAPVYAAMFLQNVTLWVPVEKLS